MAERFIQLKRNKNVFLDGKTAYSVVDAPDFLTSKKDGEAIIARYKIDSTKPATKENLAVAVGHVIKTSEVECIVFNDINLLEHAVGVDHNVSSITQYVSGTTNYIKDDSDIVEALITLDNNLHDVIENADNLAKVIGVTTADTTINQYISGNTTYISGDTTVIKALTTLDKKSVSGVTVEQDLIDGQYDDTTSDKYTTTVTLNDGTEYDDDVQLRYTAWSPANLQVPQTIGDIEKGTKASELNGETISKILDDIIFPTKYPIITNPTISMVFKDTNNTTAKVVKFGSKYYDLKGVYNRGKATIDDGVSPAKYYTGDLTNATFTQIFTSGKTDNTAIASSYMTDASQPAFDVTITHSSNVPSATNTIPAGHSTCSAVTSAASSVVYDKLGVYTFKVTGNYGVGDNLITSKSSNPGSPLRYESLAGVANNPQAPYKTVVNPKPADSITLGTATCQVSVTLPIFITTGATVSTASTSPVSTKEVVSENATLNAWGAVGNATSGGWTVTFPATTNADGNRRVILTPRKLSGIYIPDLSGALKTQSIGDYLLMTDTVQVTINGTVFPYYQYRWNGGNAGSLQARITWS